LKELKAMARDDDETTDDLTTDEWESIGAYAYGELQGALVSPSYDNLLSVVKDLSDIFHPDSQLKVNTKNDTVEVTGWEPGDEDEEEDE
jgi:hypothetical protein